MRYNYSKKPILGKISLQKVDLGEDYTQKVQENFKKRSISDKYYRGSITYWSPCTYPIEPMILNHLDVLFEVPTEILPCERNHFGVIESSPLDHS